MIDDPVHRIRTVCLALPEVDERFNHGEPSWTVRRRTVAQYTDRLTDGRPNLWCPAPAGAREAMVAAEPQRFFVPPHGGHGWVGIRLDVQVDWAEVREIVVEAYLLVAPQKLAARLTPPTA